MRVFEKDRYVVLWNPHKQPDIYLMAEYNFAALLRLTVVSRNPKFVREAQRMALCFSSTS